eukprot:757215-Hanusia_phi.AAC.3
MFKITRSISIPTQTAASRVAGRSCCLLYLTYVGTEAEHEETLAAKRSKAPPKAVDSSEDAQKVEVAEGEESEAGLKEGEEDIKSETGPLEISE